MGPELLADQFSYNQRVLEINTRGLSQEESLAAPAAGGNCLNWVVGHVVATRNHILELLGHEPIWSAERAAAYKRGSEPMTAENALPLAEILADFAASQKTLLKALSDLSEEDLMVKSPVAFFKGEAETVGSALGAFFFHEAYHVGQTGVLRRVAGRKGAIA